MRPEKAVETRAQAIGTRNRRALVWLSQVPDCAEGVVLVKGEKPRKGNPEIGGSVAVALRLLSGRRTARASRRYRGEFSGRPLSAGNAGGHDVAQVSDRPRRTAAEPQARRRKPRNQGALSQLATYEQRNAQRRSTPTD